MDKMSRIVSLKNTGESEEFNVSPITNKTNRKPIVWGKSVNNQDMKISYEQVLKKRKERFGEVSPPKPKYQKTTDISTISADHLNLLKKRSERFGESASYIMKKIEEKDKRMKRQERFSTGMVTSLPTANHKQLNVKVFQHTPSPTIELFKTIDQIEAEKRRKITFE